MSRLALEKHCWAEIDLTALRSNFEYIHRAVGGDICAVVKADAYGHGDTTIAHALQQAGAAAFAVSSLGEGPAPAPQRHHKTDFDSGLC